MSNTCIQAFIRAVILIHNSERQSGLIYPQVIPNEIIITCGDDRGRHYPKCNQRLVMVRFSRCHSSTACNIEEIRLCLLNCAMNFNRK